MRALLVMLLFTGRSALIHTEGYARANRLCRAARKGDLAQVKGLLAVDSALDINQRVYKNFTHLKSTL
jgi:hypothetical protein